MQNQFQANAGISTGALVRDLPPEAPMAEIPHGVIRIKENLVTLQNQIDTLRTRLAVFSDVNSKRDSGVCQAPGYASEFGGFLHNSANEMAALSEQLADIMVRLAI